MQRIEAEEVAKQRAAYTALLERLGRATAEEIDAVLEEREAAVPERELTPEVVERFRDRLAQAATARSD